jgi:hypothetical protein
MGLHNLWTATLKFVPVHVMKAYEEVWPHSFLTSALDKGGHLYSPATLPLGKVPLMPVLKRLGGPQSQCAHFGEEKNVLPLPGSEPQFFDCPAHNLVSILTWLPQSAYTDSWMYWRIVTCFVYPDTRVYGRVVLCVLYMDTSIYWRVVLCVLHSHMLENQGFITFCTYSATLFYYVFHIV